MRVTIDGTEVGPERLGPPAMNYGQLHRWQDFTQVAYEYVASVEEFVSALDNWFDTYRAEIQEEGRVGRTGVRPCRVSPASRADG